MRVSLWCPVVVGKGPAAKPDTVRREDRGGVGIGLPAAAVLTRLMESQLFGISPLDPATHLAVALVLVVAAGLASYISARRASALDPVEVLKGV
jgi:ABC-type antimicrobial peptide transport system permease subunit